MSNVGKKEILTQKHVVQFFPLYDANREVYGLLRYGVKVRPMSASRTSRSG
jgi:hypothetical protein